MKNNDTQIHRRMDRDIEIEGKSQTERQIKIEKKEKRDNQKHQKTIDSHFE